MKISFTETLASDITTIVLPVNEGAMPDSVPAVLREGAGASRFKGKTGQIFDGFAEVDGKAHHFVLVGAGKPDAATRPAALEKAGAAVAAKFLTSGKTALGVDFAGSNVDAAGAAAFLLGLRLRSWRIDTYRTRLKDEQKPSLKDIVVTGAPAGTDAAWTDAAAVATGVEFTRELVSEPANKIYPESFVERCKARLEGTGIEITVLRVEEMTELGGFRNTLGTDGMARPISSMCFR